ncbi:hypothetical protein BDW22DRAFT_1430712 [Trametopsis cervina]|nr:hypothetical protein BDW22DRAFT_1430712 [Trametopsis cervina]
MHGGPPCPTPPPVIDFCVPVDVGNLLLLLPISLQAALDLHCPEEWKGGPEEVLPFLSNVTRITCRINWPGYLPQHEPVNVTDFRKVRKFVNRAKLAQNVARAVDKVIRNLRNQRQAILRGCWDLNSNAFDTRNVFLASLCQVSRGSWQPELYFWCEDQQIMKRLWLDGWTGSLG